MGEYADYILNGDDCQECGMYIGEGDGFPRTCAGCAKGFSAALPIEGGKPSGKLPVACLDANCRKRFGTRDGMLMHVNAKHPKVFAPFDELHPETQSLPPQKGGTAS